MPLRRVAPIATLRSWGMPHHHVRFNIRRTNSGMSRTGVSHWTEPSTAAKPVTRATAERAMSQFLERVTQVNQNPYFLAKATSAVLFGSMLKPEVERLSDVDLAVELTRKEPDHERALEQNQQRAEELANMGRRLRNFLEVEGCWYWEAFRFLKGRNRVIALADFNAEKTFVLAVPHRFLIGEPEQVSVQLSPTTAVPAARKRHEGGLQNRALQPSYRMMERFPGQTSG